jgi:hypothetical protein
LRLREEKTFSVVCVRATGVGPSIWSQIGNQSCNYQMLYNVWSINRPLSAMNVELTTNIESFYFLQEPFSFSNLILSL